MAEPRAVAVRAPAELGAAAARLGLSGQRPVAVVVGGAAGMEPADEDSIRRAFVQALVPVVERVGGAVVDGATDAGVMRLVGEARAEAAAGFPLVGVVVEKLLGDHAEAAAPEPRHTHFLLVPGDDWGDESKWLASFASTLAGAAPSVTVLANGGEIALDDVRRSITERRPVLVLAGSGRVADALAAPRTPGLEEFHRTGLVAVLPVDRPDLLRKALARVLGPRRRRGGSSTAD